MPIIYVYLYKSFSTTRQRFEKISKKEMEKLENIN